MSKIVLSFGSNISPRRRRLEETLSMVCAYPQTELLCASEIEETEPVGVPQEFAHMKFLNRVAIFRTALDPEDFSRRMHETEDAMGRVRGNRRNVPRTIDIDMVDYGGMVLETEELTLPHPRARERDFVFRPWMELEKKLIRDEMKALRMAVDPQERQRKSEELSLKLNSLLTPDVRRVCVYRAMKTELDVSGFEHECLRRGIAVSIPEQKARSYAVAGAEDVDLWICPGLAFTADGKRLGFGGGWYDRFLAGAKPSSKAYGVAYSFQMRDDLPQGEWDLPLDGVIVV